MTVNPGDPTPAYVQIANQLRSQIQRGELRDGQKLPSLRELIEQSGSALGTVRQAISQLESEGLVITRQGSGTFVRHPRRLRRDGSTRHVPELRTQGSAPMEAEAGQQDFKRTSSVLSAGTVSAEPRVSSRLKIADGTPVLLRRFVLHLSKGAAGREPASQEPAQLADSYFPARLADDPVLRSPASVPGGTHEYLKRELGIAIDYADEDLIARMPTPDEVLALRLAPGTPVVELIRTIYMADAEPVEVTIFVCAADRFEFTYRVPMA